MVLWLALADFNLHKLLCAVNVKLPEWVLPVGKNIVRNHGNAFKPLSHPSSPLQHLACH